MRLPEAVTLECKRCGGNIIVPIAVEGPFKDDEKNEAYCEVFADVREVEHRCSVRRPPTKPAAGKPRRVRL